MNLDKIDRRYVSPYDKFLDELRQKLPESHSQKVERLKDEKISEKRDNPDYAEIESIIWTEF